MNYEYWLTICIIITAHYFVTIAASRVLLIFVCVRFSAIRLASLYLLSNSLKICLYNKWCRHLTTVVLEVECIFVLLWHPNSLLTIYYHTIGHMLVNYLFMC